MATLKPINIRAIKIKHPNMQPKTVFKSKLLAKIQRFLRSFRGTRAAQIIREPIWTGPRLLPV